MRSSPFAAAGRLRDRLYIVARAVYTDENLLCLVASRLLYSLIKRATARDRVWWIFSTTYIRGEDAFYFSPQPSVVHDSLYDKVGTLATIESWMGYYYSRVTKQALRICGRCDGKHLSTGLLFEIPETCFAKHLTNRYTVHFICTFGILLCHAKKEWLS